jgi:hypothetical protein
VIGRPRRLGLTAVGVLALALAGGDVARAAGEPRLVVEDARGARVLHGERVEAGVTFRLDYVHSSEGVAVRGTFRVESDGTLTVVETGFGGFGPGLPELGPGDDWRLDGGLIVLRPRDVALPELRVRVSAIARPQLTTPSGAVLDLAALAGHGTPVVVRILPGRPPS